MSQILQIGGEEETYYDEVTFFREFSILTIVVMHYLQNIGLPGVIDKVLSIGGTGVHVFPFARDLGYFFRI